ncbi:MAG: SCP2 sterol-binding domain-containing protein [Pseudomonadota bacterium]|nr:SCP2 sterol-binding domain-containing protein [Pseudomonadota bacterium]
MKLPLFLLNSLLPSIERAINPMLLSDPVNRAHLQTLAGKRLRFLCTEPELSLTIDVNPEGLHLFSDHSARQQADLTLSGDMAQWRAQLNAEPNKMAVAIDGDVQLAAKLLQLIEDLHIDWGALLEPKVGRTASQLFQLSAERIQHQGQVFLSSLKRNLSDFLLYESQLTVSQSEAKAFYQDVDSLRQSADRLEAKIKHFAKTQGK